MAQSVNCPLCGKFAVTYQDSENLNNSRNREWSAFEISALLRERHVGPFPPYLLRDGTVGEREGYTAIDVKDLKGQWPRSVLDRIDRTLVNLARLSPTIGHRITVDLNDTSLAFAQTSGELLYTIKALGEFVTHSSTYNTISVILTPSGWARFEQLTRGAKAPENPVFVAMWFGEGETRQQMDDIYRRGILPAVEKVGYKVTRVDFKQHNNFIMDEVLGGIRIAPFVVADYTGNRHGVYYEAGFALGLGIPVVSMCREADFPEVHFDIKQLNHILWTGADDLQNKLYHRILGSIGKGPHPPPPTL
jgi:hypothetical protein